MPWLKKGLIFEPPKNLDWMVTHTALPVFDKENDLQRIYFSGRDNEGRAKIGYVNVDLPQNKILSIHHGPVLGLGKLGTFDDRGVTLADIVNLNGQKYLYYSGWTLGVTVPFYFYIGLAISDDGGNHFYRVSESPLLDRNEFDPYLTASPCVLIEDGLWRMWYVSCTKWVLENDLPKHYYHIKYAESSDGISWTRTGRVCIDFKSSDEYAISRPCVIKDDDMYRMWYSYRGASYRIGYAESQDGLHWIRKDEQVGIDVSETGWDSEMICYPHVFDHDGRRYMLYNGNGYGKTGIGLAILD